MPNVPILYPSEGKLAKQTSIGYMRDLVGPSAFDEDVFEDKFWGDALLGLYPSAKTNGTSAAVTFAEHNINGFLSFVSGTADDGYAGQGMGLQFSGDRGVLFEAIVETPGAVTTMKVEVGLSDADDDAGAVNQKATTTTVTATDTAVLCFDTDDDTNWGFFTAKAGTVTENHDKLAIAVSTVYRCAIRVETDSVAAWINGQYMGGGTIEGGNALTPWVFVQARTGSASRTLKLHKWRVTQPAW